MTADEEISVLKDAIVIDVPGDPQLDPKSVSQDYQSTLSVETSGDAVLSFEDNFVQDTNVLEESDVITSFVDLTQEQSAQMAKWIEDSLEREMNAVSHDSAPIDYVNPLTAPDSLTEETGDDFNEDEPIGSGSTEKELNGGGRKWETHITYCSLCSKDVTHFPDHLKTYHKDEDDVKDMIKYQVIFAEHNRIVKMIKGASEEEQQKRQEDLLESQKKVKEMNKKVREITGKLRRRGNYELNLKAPLKSEIRTKKRPNHKAYIPTRATHGTCHNCLATIRNENLSLHIRTTCPGKSSTERDDEDERTTRRRAVKTSMQMLTPTPDNIPESFQKDILNAMHNNMVTLIARTDPLILDVALPLYTSKREHKHIKNIRKVMRDLARLYITIDEQQEEDEAEGKNPSPAKLVKNFTDCIDPKKFDLVIKGVQSLADFDQNTGAVKVVGISGRFCNALKICAEALKSNAVQSKTMPEFEKDKVKANMNEWLDIMRFEWRYKIGTTCESTRKRNLANKNEVIPLDEDVRTLSLRAEGLYPETIEALKENPSKRTFETLCRLIIVDIILLCRRRPAEVCRATMLNYSRLTGDDDRNYQEDFLTAEERRKGSEIKIFYVTGKGDTPVPILITKFMENGIDTLKKFKPHFGLSSEPEDLLFPRPFEKDSIYDGSIAMSEFVKKTKLLKPELVNCRSLRCHAATESQMHKQDSMYTSNLTSFLGHTLSVHHKHYRRPVPLVHRAQVGTRLLRIREASYTPTSTNTEAVSEDQMDKETDLDLDKNTDLNPDADTDLDSDSNLDLDYIKRTAGKKRRSLSTSDSDHCSSEEDQPKKSKTKKVCRVRWDPKDVQILQKTFEKELSKGVVPERKSIKSLYDKQPNLQKRSFNSVVTYVQQTLLKKKR
ncbi:unnamed protein product [Bemisia tabaci]|uniref:Uncharacterized protein n=2 Tax=Bemisia tabaci TaxID=7038 RepID=A0A9P0CAI0_BEMTA|nr:unnamed protein product [Bemisia tabaci]